MHYVAAFLSALLFGLGLGVSGMTDPGKVQGFLDILGPWKIDLLFVLMGAVAVHSLLYYFIIRRERPLLNPEFYIPRKKYLDAKLLVGSALFGIGWGLGGYCPGPSIASLFTLEPSLLTFVGSMVVGTIFYHYIFKPLFLK